MRKLAFIFSIMAFPALAEEAKPPFWIMLVQLKNSSFNVSYTNENSCKDALKLMMPALKKMGRADCLPIFQQ